jgi:2-polyprenyl-3-methyl-5-hydroxy-6-metoxy-1,4-benzoquinol methylase
MNFRHRSYEKELMDAPDLSREDFHTNLREIVTINKYLGGANITWKGIKTLDDGGELTLTDIGAGAGDVFDYIDKKLSQSDKSRFHFEAVDIQPDAETFSQEAFPHLTRRIRWTIADYRDHLSGKEKTDVVLASLFCHHLTDEELIEFLQLSLQNTRKGIVINDLHRHPFAYYSIKCLTRWFSNSHFSKNDAPLSVLRGFTHSEWTRLLLKAGIANFSISWQWAFRYLIVIRK